MTYLKTQEKNSYAAFITKTRRSKIIIAHLGRDESIAEQEEGHQPHERDVAGLRINGLNHNQDFRSEESASYRYKMWY